MDFPKPPNRKNTTKGTPPKIEDATDENLQRLPPQAPEQASKSKVETEKVKDLNFKVPESFARSFKLKATERGLSMVEYLKWLVAQAEK